MFSHIYELRDELRQFSAVQVKVTEYNLTQKARDRLEITSQSETNFVFPIQSELYGKTDWIRKFPLIREYSKCKKIVSLFKHFAENYLGEFVLFPLWTEQELLYGPWHQNFIFSKNSCNHKKLSECKLHDRRITGEMWSNSFWVLVEHKYFLQLHNHCASTISIIFVFNLLNVMSRLNILKCQIVKNLHVWHRVRPKH